MAGSANAPGTERADVLGTPVDTCTAEAVRTWLRQALADPWNGRCRHVVTLNPEYVMAARRDPAFASALQAGDLVTADGVGIVVAVRLIHGSSLHRVTGVDLVEWLAAESGPSRAPLFLLGAAPGVADEAARRLRARHPEALFVGTWAGGTADPADDAQTLARIRASGARTVAVAYGAPGQITWIARNGAGLERAGVRAVIGVGGALDYHSGAVARPPALVRRMGLEWVVRLAREPRRWRRQLVLPHFALLVIRDAARVRLRGVAR